MSRRQSGTALAVPEAHREVPARAPQPGPERTPLARRPERTVHAAAAP